MTDKENSMLNIALNLKYFGIEIENTETTTGGFGVMPCTKCYFSVPESSTLYLKDKDDTINERLKTSEGLIQIAKELIVDMIICSENSEFISPEEIAEMKANKSNSLKFYAKVRQGDIWSNKKGDLKLKEAIKKIDDVTGYKEA